MLGSLLFVEVANPGKKPLAMAFQRDAAALAPEGGEGCFSALFSRKLDLH